MNEALLLAVLLEHNFVIAVGRRVACKSGWSVEWSASGWTLFHEPDARKVAAGGTAEGLERALTKMEVEDGPTELREV